MCLYWRHAEQSGAKQAAEQVTMKTQAQIIKASLKGLFIQGLITRKGWSQQQAADHVVGWLTSGKQVSFHDYMVAA